MTSPMAMLIVGSHLADMKLKELFASKSVYLVCFLKLMISPLIALLLVKMFIGTDSLIASVLILQAAMPVAMCSVIFSEQYRADVNFAAKGVLLSSLLCIFTIPAFAILLQYS